MKDSGVSDKDPEYQKIKGMLVAMQQRSIFAQQKLAYSQQMQPQQQNARVNAANGNTPQQTPQPVAQIPAQAPATSAPGQPVGKGAANAPGATAQTPQRPAAAGSGYFTPEQLG